MSNDASTESPSASFDSFGRMRTSSPIAQFEYQNQYNKGPLLWSEQLSGTGSVTHQANSATVLLSTGGTASGAKAVRQTRRYFRYTPGKSLLFLGTFMFGAGLPNVRKRVGYFDADNGVFIQQIDQTVSLVLRSKTSGVVVDTTVNQIDWNTDSLNGQGDSLIQIDWTKSQILVIDFQWLGVGSVRIGFEIDGKVYWAHEFKNANKIQNTYMTSANLPIRYEIENTGTAASGISLVQICSTVMTEQGSLNDLGFYTRGAGNGITAISVTTRRAVLSIRPKATFNSIVNRGRIEPADISLLVGTNNVYWELVYGATLGGSPSWNSVSDNSLTEFDVAGTTITGGEVIACGYANAGTGANRNLFTSDILSLYPLTLDIDGANPLHLSLVCTSFTGTASVTGAMNWREYY